jgi:hypothetical protein
MGPEQPYFQSIRTAAPVGLSRDQAQALLRDRVSQLGDAALDDLCSEWLVRLRLHSEAASGGDRQFVGWLAAASADLLLDAPGDLETHTNERTGRHVWQSGTRDRGPLPATMLAIEFLDSIDAFSGAYVS